MEKKLKVLRDALLIAAALLLVWHFAVKHLVMPKEPKLRTRKETRQYQRGWEKARDQGIRVVNLCEGKYRAEIEGCVDYVNGVKEE